MSFIFHGAFDWFSFLVFAILSAFWKCLVFWGMCGEFTARLTIKPLYLFIYGSNKNLPTLRVSYKEIDSNLGWGFARTISEILPKPRKKRNYRFGKVGFFRLWAPYLIISYHLPRFSRAPPQQSHQHSAIPPHRSKSTLTPIFFFAGRGHSHASLPLERNVAQSSTYRWVRSRTGWGRLVACTILRTLTAPSLSISLRTVRSSAGEN